MSILGTWCGGQDRFTSYISLVRYHDMIYNKIHRKKHHNRTCDPSFAERSAASSMRSDIAASEIEESGSAPLPMHSCTKCRVKFSIVYW